MAPFVVGGNSAGAASLKLNKGLAALADVAAFAGGFGVLDGLTLSVSSGLTLAIAAGHALIMGVVEYPGGTSVLPDNTAHVYLWLKVDGTIEARTATTPASSSGICIGTCKTLAGVISNIDYAGVTFLMGGMPTRWTADLSKPADSPSSGFVFLTKTLGGDFLWDGDRYVSIPWFGRVAVAMADANQTLSQAQYSHRTIESTGALTAGRNVILPAIDGAEWVCVNSTTGGFAVTFKTGGTGIAVAAGKTAILRCDGTNILRVTADV